MCLEVVVPDLGRAQKERERNRICCNFLLDTCLAWYLNFSSVLGSFCFLGTWNYEEKLCALLIIPEKCTHS